MRQTTGITFRKDAFGSLSYQRDWRIVKGFDALSAKYRRLRPKTGIGVGGNFISLLTKFQSAIINL